MEDRGQFDLGLHVSSGYLYPNIQKQYCIHLTNNFHITDKIYPCPMT